MNAPIDDMKTQNPAPVDAPVEILVVDDMPQNLFAVQALLERPQLRVLTAESGSAALELLLTRDVALALLDVQMPEMDGFTLAELMRGAERTRQIPIIFMTAASSDVARTFRGYESGAVDFLYKPVDPEVLCSKVSVFVDLYDQRRRLHAGMEELRRVIALNERMTAVLAHDLRTPLAAILMGSSLLARHRTDDNVAQAGRSITASAARMQRMIDQLLDFSRIRAGQLRLDRRRVDIAQVAAGVADELRHAQPDADVAIASTGDSHAHVDADRIGQALANLIANAVQHGTRAAPVHVDIDGSDAARVVIRISNSGRLADDVAAQLFEPFRAGRNAQSGLGLGLYIVAEFVAAHGGSVDGRSHPHEEQTRFEIVLPRGTAQPAA